ncbi:hypothetical protein MFLAVUS_006578 [Mucor flavus]|uniref:RING-type domain-containing protein n=1 Tax=Mucor flavus TaxID=439312 RepID=A0ABP9Z1X9_9FUNG
MSQETRQGQPRYWCHICNAERDIYMAPDPTCQQCNEQFIEELQSDDDPRAFLAGTDSNPTSNTQLPEGISNATGAHIFSYSPSTGRINNINGSNEDDLYQYFTPRTNTEEGAENNVPPLGNFVQNLLTNILGPNIELPANTGGDGEATTRPMMFYGSMVDGNMRFQPVPGMPGAMPAEGEQDTTNQSERGTGERGGTGEEAGATGRGNNIASILQFFSALTGAPMDAGLVGNPNDYVFSQTALDNIITQLMEQTGGASAPPPAPEQVIEALPKRALTDEEKSTETDCAVCKDQFESHEIVIELPCEHIFHDECIKPWLKLNSTCPVCRHSVLPEQESNEDNNNNNTQNTQGSENNNSEGNSNTTASFTWTGGNGTAQASMPASWPLNLANGFPWASLSGRTNQSNTPNQTSTTDQSNNQNTNDNTSSNPMDEDLDLD